MSASVRSCVSTITQVEPEPSYDPVVKLHAVSRVLLKLQKYGLMLLFVATNGALIWATTMAYLSKGFWYIPLPVISVYNVMQVVFVLGIMAAAVRRWVLRYVLRCRAPVREVPEKLAMVLSCCGESQAEVQRSLSSLVRQSKIEEHPRVIMCVVDGNVKAPGEDMTTQEYLMDVVFKNGVCEDFENGYVARDGVIMPLKVKWGVYEAMPYILIGKMKSQGKQDTSWFVRSFLHHYEKRSGDVSTIL